MRTTQVVPVSPLSRVIAAIGSLLLLAALIGGLPVALIGFAGNPLPADISTVGDVWTALTAPDDGSLFLSLLALVGWVAWAGFTGSVLLEVLGRVTRRRTPSVPGMQRLATVLVTAVAAVAASPTLTSASAALVDSPPATEVTAPVDPVVRGFGERADVQGAAPQTALHLVERGEGLLDLQDRYGVPWQRIAEANFGVEQPDGRTLERGQARIYAGWQLHIPVAATPGTAGIGTAGGGTAGGGTAGGGTAATIAPSEQPQVGFGAAPDESGTGGASAPAEYEVAQGDWMWHIADRYLGDPERYPEIAALNPQYAAQHGDYPDHIQPGWTLQLPPDAEDQGAHQHATGEATPAPPAEAEEDVEPEPEEEPEPEPEDELEPEPEPEETPEPEKTPEPEETPAPPPAERDPAQEVEKPAPSPGYAGPAPPAPPVVPGPAAAGFGSAPDPAPVPGGTGNGHGTAGNAGAGSDAGDAFSPAEDAAERQLERLAPAALAGAGLLTALVLGAAALHRHRRRQHHRTGHRFVSAPAQRMESALRSAQQPLDTARLDTALRSLAAALAARGTGAGGDGGSTGPGRALPDVAGAMVDHGTVHLLLAAPCPDPPAPWQDNGDRWTLPAGTAAPAVVGPAPLAPLPTLAAVGSQAGVHLLLDLERLGFLAIHGDPGGARDLLRYLAAELSCNTWSDAAEVLVTGFDPAETELLVTLSGRCRPVPSIADALALLRRRAASVRTTLGHAGAADTLAGRVKGVAGDAWMPQVLIAAAATPADMAALATLEAELAGARCAVAVATTDPNPPPHDAWRVTVTPDGVVHVRLPFLRASLAAAALSVAELAPLAETMRAARAAPTVPVAPAPEIEPWAAGTDAAGTPVAAVAPVAPPAGTYPTHHPAPRSPDLDLDADLRTWYEGGAGRPRIGVLGPVVVDAAGPVPESRRRLHAELVVYLAQRGARGADAGQLDAALWPDVTVTEPSRQLALTRIRRWLGPRPDGFPWLLDVDADLAYRLAEGYLFDWHLFRRLRARGVDRGTGGAAELRAALQLVRGAPLDGADRPQAPGTRNPYPWLAESDLHPDHLVATIVDTAHELAEVCLAAGDPAGARWAVQQAWLADPARGFDQPWRDLLRAEQADGQTGRLRAVLAELMESRDAEAPEDLSPETYRLISTWPAGVLVPAG